jgi:hypothetical protein
MLCMDLQNAGDRPCLTINRRTADCISQCVKSIAHAGGDAFETVNPGQRDDWRSASGSNLFDLFTC